MLLWGHSHIKSQQHQLILIELSFPFTCGCIPSITVWEPWCFFWGRYFCLRQHDLGVWMHVQHNYQWKSKKFLVEASRLTLPFRKFLQLSQTRNWLWIKGKLRVDKKQCIIESWERNSFSSKFNQVSSQIAVITLRQNGNLVSK